MRSSEKTKPEGSWLYWVLYYFFRVVFVVFLRARCFGRHHVPRRGPVILVSNHQSYFDPPFVGTFISRPLQFMARESLFKNRYFGPLIRSLNAFPVRRGETDVTAIKHSLRLLREGRALLLFAEGTRTLDGRIQDFHSGFLSLARRSKASIVPVAIDGMHEAWPRHARFPRLTRVFIEYGDPIPIGAFEGCSNEEGAARLTKLVRAMQNKLRERANRPVFEYPEPDVDMTQTDSVPEGATHG